MGACPDVWDRDDYEPIYEKYPDAKSLLDRICTYYPLQYNEQNLDQAQLIGRGAEAYVFFVNDVVVKFTQSRAHAKVSNRLAKSTDSFGFLVATESVEYLPALGLWCIREEKLFKLNTAQSEELEMFFDTEPNAWLSPSAEADVRNIIMELDRLPVLQWKEDCVAVHNLMQDSYGRIKAFDFGFTRCDEPEDWSEWA